MPLFTPELTPDQRSANLLLGKVAQSLNFGAITQKKFNWCPVTPT